jgi:hypothetical protein
MNRIALFAIALFALGGCTAKVGPSDASTTDATPDARHFGQPIGPVSGDLCGFAQDPTVCGIQNTPVSDAAAPDSGLVALVLSGGKWAASSIATADSGTFTPGCDINPSSTVSCQTIQSLGNGISESTITVDAPSLTWASSASNPVITQAAGAGAGANMDIEAQSAGGGNTNGGVLGLLSGAGAGSGHAGNVVFLTGDFSTGFTAQAPPTSLLELFVNNTMVLQSTPSLWTLGVSTVEWGSGVSSPILTQATGSGAGNALDIIAQNAGGSSNNGGNLGLSSGNSTGSGHAGQVVITTGDIESEIILKPGALAPAVTNYVGGSLHSTFNSSIEGAPGYWLGTSTPTSSNFTLLTSGDITVCNGVEDVEFWLNGTTPIAGYQGAGITNYYTSLNVTASSPTTLTSAQYQFPKLFFTGSMSGTSIYEVIFPAVNGSWRVDVTGLSFVTGAGLAFCTGSCSGGTTEWVIAGSQMCQVTVGAQETLNGCHGNLFTVDTTPTGTMEIQ